MNSRDSILKKNVSFAVLYKILNMGIAFFTIPMVLNYLGTKDYGVWVTIFSIVNVIIYLDGGIINGLKTNLAVVISNNEHEQAKSYVSSAYILLIIFALILFLLGLTFLYFIDLQDLLKTEIDHRSLKSIFYIVLTTGIVGFVLSLYKPLFYANQQSSMVELSMLINQTVIFVIILIFLNYFKSSIQYVALVYGASAVLTGVIFSYFFFKKDPDILPSLKFFNNKISKTLFSLSIEFFIIQLCMIVIFNTDYIIISYLLGSEEVAKYDVVFKFFQFFITFSVIIQDPYWAMYTDAYQKKDFVWIKKTLKNWNLIFVGYFLFVLLIIFTSKPLIKFWLQDDLEVPSTLIFLMGTFVILRVYGVIYMYFLNGIGKIKLQKWLYVFGAVINIPLSIFFVKIMNMGSSGVILGTILSLLPMVIVLPLQSHKILKNEFHLLYTKVN